MRRFNLCPNCLRAHKKGLCQSKTRCLVDRCNGFHHSTLHRTDARHQQQNAQPNGNWNQISQNNTFRKQTNQNQSNYGQNFNNENQKPQTSSSYNQQNGNMNRQSGSSSSASHRGNWNKMIFTLSGWTRKTAITTDSKLAISALWPSSRQLLRNKTRLAATNRKLLGSDRRYSCRQNQ